MESYGDEPEPVHLRPRPERVHGAVGIARVAVVETDHGVHVEVEDDAGNRRLHAVGSDGSIDAAVIAAIRGLIEVPDAAVITATDVATSDGEVVVATVTGPGIARAAGAAYVDFGRPWALARAVIQALS